MRAFAMLVALAACGAFGCGSDDSSEEQTGSRKNSGESGKIDTCREIIECYVACEDDTCVKACADAPPQARAAFDGIWRCMMFECDGDWDEACLQQNCPEAYAACD